MSDNIRDLMEESEAELETWTQALDELEALTPPPRKRGRLRRTVILASILGAVLLVAAGAFHTQVLNWLETAHEQYTQLQAGKTAQEELDGWTGAYIPNYLPPDYALRDAMSTEHFKVLEYADSIGGRITFYQYSANANVRIDTEKADKTVFPWVGETAAYQFEKGGQTTLYWSSASCVFSITYDSASIPDAEIMSFAQNIEWRQ